MNKKDIKCKNLSAQGSSDLLGLGGRRAIVPDSPLLLSGVGLDNAKKISETLERGSECDLAIRQLIEIGIDGAITGTAKKEVIFCGGSQEPLRTHRDDTEDYIKMLETLVDLLKKVPIPLRGKILFAVETMLGYISNLSATVNKLEDARKYILIKVNKQKDRIQELQSELDTMKSLVSFEGSVECMRGTGILV